MEVKMGSIDKEQIRNSVRDTYAKVAIAEHNVLDG